MSKPDPNLQKVADIVRGNSLMSMAGILRKAGYKVSSSMMDGTGMMLIVSKRGQKDIAIGHSKSVDAGDNDLIDNDYVFGYLGEAKVNKLTLGAAYADLHPIHESRAVTDAVASAFMSGQSKRVGNSHTDGNGYFLHGNKIAEKRNGELWITSAGWNTNTTKERLNGLPGVSIQQKAKKWYLNGNPWDGKWIAVNSNEEHRVSEQEFKGLRKLFTENLDRLSNVHHNKGMKDA